MERRARTPVYERTLLSVAESHTFSAWAVSGLAIEIEVALAFRERVSVLRRLRRVGWSLYCRITGGCVP
jgi:hypothetical protein